MSDLNRYIDHTLLKPNATKQQIIELCSQAKENDFATVCINPSWIETATKELAGSNTGICTVVGFPLGANTSQVKAFEASDAIRNGATEIDMVINIGALIDGDSDYVEKDIKTVADACGNTPLKVIFETCLLNNQQIELACKLSASAGATFVKTSTGFSDGGATLEHVKLMKESIPEHMQVKASGGIRSLETATEMINAGATRLGTSSGVKIMNGESGSGY